jgi:hypothetical protein
MLDLSRTIRRHRDQILAAVELSLSNSKLEGLNSKIRLINHRGYGHHSPAAVIAMIYLCGSGLTITLPTGRRGDPETQVSSARSRAWTTASAIMRWPTPASLRAC